MSDDDFRRNMEMRMMFRFASSSPRAHIKLPTEGLPEPLRRSAEQMQADGSPDARKAAGREFLTLSEEWIDRA